jgi:hypothetical protein
LIQPLQRQHQDFQLIFLRSGSRQEVCANHLQTIASRFIGSEHQGTVSRARPTTRIWLLLVFLDEALSSIPVHYVHYVHLGTFPGGMPSWKALP